MLFLANNSISADEGSDISFSLVDQLTIIFGNENAVFFMLFVVTLFTIHSPN